MGVTAELAERISAVRYADIPPVVIDVARAVVLDGLGVTLAGHTEALASILVEHARAVGGTPEASVVGTSLRTSAPMAAFVNGTLCHALDFDNTWYPLTHPTSPSLPGLLALGQKLRLPGSRLVEALVVAFEVQGRIRLAGTRAWPVFARDAFHPPGLYGTLGAAAGCARLLELEPRDVRRALGLAASWCGGLRANVGTMVKPAHAGTAARAGVEAALLAVAGYTANEDVLEAEGGVGEAFFGPGGFDLPLVLEGFGEPYRMETPGVGFKKYPANYYTHRPIDAALELRERGVAAQNLVSLEVSFPPLAYVSRPSPRTGLEGKFSVQYAMAVALLDGRVVIDSFTDRRRFASDVKALLPRIRVVMDESIPVDFAETYVVARARLGDGGVVEARVDQARGMWGRPLTPEERTEKFFDCAERVVGRERAEHLRALVERLDALPDVSELAEATMLPGDA
jgi:aconitate decarboxylase